MPEPCGSDATQAGGEDGDIACSDATEAGSESSNACSNCGHARTGRFCARCGQNDRDYIRSLPPVLGDMLKETFELDSRLLRTVKPMFFRPGELPSEFSRNRRASYVSPIRFYIFASLAFFFLLSLTADFEPPRGGVSPAQEGGELAKFSKGASEDADVDALKALLPPNKSRKVDDILAHPRMAVSKSAVYALSILAAEREEPPADWELFLLARLVDALEDPRAAYALLLDNLPFAMFVTLPGYVVLLMLFFAGSRRYFTEHLVFAVQLHTFAFLVFAVLVVLPDDDKGPRRRPPPPDVAVEAGAHTIAPDALPVAGEAGEASGDDEDDDTTLVDWVGRLLMLWVAVYHYLALRRYYGNGRVKTAFKWGMLSCAYGILLMPGFLFSLTLTFVQL